MFDGNEQALEHYKKLADRGIHPLELLSREPDTEEVCPPCLEVFDIDGIAKYAMKHRCRNVVVLCGAGISTAAGIPDFRTPGTGLYTTLHEKYPDMIGECVEQGSGTANGDGKSL